MSATTITYYAIAYTIPENYRVSIEKKREWVSNAIDQIKVSMNDCDIDINDLIILGGGYVYPNEFIEGPWDTITVNLKSFIFIIGQVSLNNTREKLISKTRCFYNTFYYKYYAPLGVTREQYESVAKTLKIYITGEIRRDILFINGEMPGTASASAPLPPAPRTTSPAPGTTPLLPGTAAPLPPGTAAPGIAARVELKKILNNPSTININETGFNIITQETVVILEYLNESVDNIVFKVGNNYFLSDKETIKLQLKNARNIKYECIKAGTTSRYMMDSNINYRNPFFSLSSILGIQSVANMKNVKDILNNGYVSQLYEVKKTPQKLAAIISKAFIDGAGGVSADHCQPGKETMVYDFIVAEPIFDLKKENSLGAHETKDEGTGFKETNEEPTFQETKEEPTLTIMYKGKPHIIDIHSGITIETLKTNVLNMLVSKGLISHANQNVKFIYAGKIITDNSLLLNSLNPDGMVGQTMQVMISPKTPVGGKKRKSRQKKTRRKSIKRRQGCSRRNRRTRKY